VVARVSEVDPKLVNRVYFINKKKNIVSVSDMTLITKPVLLQTFRETSCPIGCTTALWSVVRAMMLLSMLLYTWGRTGWKDKALNSQPI